MEHSRARLSDINNLPSSVIETILMKLPTREAVRTSILSRSWRYMWAKLPQFIIDQKLWDSIEVKHSNVTTLTSILYQFMAIHRGPVLKFVLAVNQLESCPEIDNLITFLSRNRIEYLRIIFSSKCYSLKSSFYTCQHLKHLELKNCGIRTPFGFDGFSKLTSLILNRCSLTNEAIRILISKSPLLELLEFPWNIPTIDLYIDAPNLRTLLLVGFTKSVTFIRVPLLASVTIRPYKSVESLYLNSHTIQSFGVINHNILTTLVHLKRLRLGPVSFNKAVDVQFTLRLMRSSPNLRSIEIGFFPNSKATTMYMEGGDYTNIWLSELKEVQLNNVTGTEAELKFIELLLAKSPTLKKILIWPSQTVVDNGCKILREVIKFQRASKECQVFYGY